MSRFFLHLYIHVSIVTICTYFIQLIWLVHIVVCFVLPCMLYDKEKCELFVTFKYEKDLEFVEFIISLCTQFPVLWKCLWFMSTHKVWFVTSVWCGDSRHPAYPYTKVTVISSFILALKLVIQCNKIKCYNFLLNHESLMGHTIVRKWLALKLTFCLGLKTIESWSWLPSSSAKVKNVYRFTPIIRIYSCYYYLQWYWYLPKMLLPTT